MAQDHTIAGRTFDRRHPRAWLIASLIFVLLRALPNLSHPLGRDQATYCVIGRGLLDGKQLYLDLWDNKPPGIFWVYALIVKLTGPVMWCVGPVDILWLLVISYFLFRFAERFLGTAGGVLAVVFNTVWHCWAGYVHAAQPKPLRSDLALVPDHPSVILPFVAPGSSGLPGSLPARADALLFRARGRRR